MARLMVLGLLKLKPMSGYEIQQLLTQSKTDLWAGILPGSIYHALKKMENEGLVELDSIEQTGNRSKAIYKITQQGIEHHHALLIQELKTPSVHLPSGLYTALSFIQDAERGDVIECLMVQRDALRQHLEQQQAGIEVKRQLMQADELNELLFANLFGQYKLQLQLVESLIEHFSK